MKTKIFTTLLLATCTYSGITTQLQPRPAIANTPISPAEVTRKELIDEVWQVVDRYYVDSQMNQTDWRATRKTYLSRNYRSMDEAYIAVRKMLKTLNDPLTRFIDPVEFKELQVASTDRNQTGIGLQLLRNRETSKITVVAPIDGSPAFNAGIFGNDVITKISNKSTDGIDASDAAKLLRGKSGSFVDLTILREGKLLSFKIKREEFKINATDHSFRETNRGKIGYIRLRQFSVNATSEVRTAISNSEQAGVVGYILDLRSNPGGLLYGAVDIARMWMNDGSIVTTKNRTQAADTLAANRTALTSKPLVVLVDGGSASASEILAGALQDNQRAKIVGTQTFGLNTVQSVRSLRGGSGLAVTIAKWLTPKGRDISKTGIQPDAIVKLTKPQIQTLVKQRNLLATLADPQYKQAIEELLPLVK